MINKFRLKSGQRKRRPSGRLFLELNPRDYVRPVPSAIDIPAELMEFVEIAEFAPGEKLVGGVDEVEDVP